MVEPHPYQYIVDNVVGTTCEIDEYLGQQPGACDTGDAWVFLLLGVGIGLLGSWLWGK